MLGRRSRLPPLAYVAVEPPRNFPSEIGRFRNAPTVADVSNLARTANSPRHACMFAKARGWNRTSLVWSFGAVVIAVFLVLPSGASLASQNSTLSPQLALPGPYPHWAAMTPQFKDTIHGYVQAGVTLLGPVREQALSESFQHPM